LTTILPLFDDKLCGSLQKTQVTTREARSLKNLIISSKFTRDTKAHFQD
jgi:hypothetical protein